MKPTLHELERMLGIERNVKPAPTRNDIDRLRHKRLSRPWRGLPAKRKKP